MHELFASLSGLAPLVVMLLAIFAGIFLNQRAVDKLEKRIDDRFNDSEKRMDARFDAVDRRFDAVNQRFDAVNERFGRIDSQLDAINAELRYFHGVTGGLGARVDILEKSK
jgi:guanylate kinase